VGRGARATQAFLAGWLVACGDSTPEETPNAPASWEEAALAVDRSCGLEVRSYCGEFGCAALAVVPNLELTSSWRLLSMTSRPLVVEVLAHDAGIAGPVSRCGKAIEALGAPDIRESPPVDGESYLCATERRWSEAKRVCAGLAGNDSFSGRNTKIELFVSTEEAR
jgi:hypothetical protein